MQIAQVKYILIYSHKKDTLFKKKVRQIPKKGGVKGLSPPLFALATSEVYDIYMNKIVNYLNIVTQKGLLVLGFYEPCSEQAILFAS